MNKKKPLVFKRVVAYLIDILIVTLLSGIVTIVFTNNTKYENDSNKLVELTSKLSQGEITSDDFFKEYDELSYSLIKDSIDVNIITCTISIIYFVIMCYYCHGITLGKYIMKLKIVSANDKKLTIFNYLLRSLIINMILSNVFSVVFVLILSKDTFMTVYPKITNCTTLLLVLSFILIMYRNDGRGVEDFMGNTKVVNFKDLEENDIVKEAKVIEEKKESEK